MQILGVAFESTHCTATLAEKKGFDFQYLETKTILGNWNISSDFNTICDTLSTIFPRKTAIIIGIPESTLFHQKMCVKSLLPNHEMLTFISSRLTQLFGESADTLAWDYETQLINGQQEIIVVAVQKTVVQHFQKTFAAARLTITALEPTSYSLARALILKTGCENCYALIELENHFLLLSIVQKKIVRCEKLLASALFHLDSHINDNPAHLFFVTPSPHDIPLNSNITTQHIALNASESLCTWGINEH